MMEIDPRTIQEIQRAITHLNDSYTQMAIDIAVLKSQMTEVMWLVRGIVGASLGFVVARGWKIFIHWKNNLK